MFGSKKRRIERRERKENERLEKIRREFVAQAELRRKAGLNEKKIRKYVEEYKNDKGILALVDYFINEAYDSPARWISDYLSQEYNNTYVEDEKHGSVAFVIHDKERLSFFQPVKGKDYYSSDDASRRFRMDFRSRGFAPIDDMNKLEAVLIIVLDRIVDKAHQLAGQNNCRINIGYRMVELYECDPPYEIGVVGDDNFMGRLRFCRYDNKENTSKDPRHCTHKGAVITISNADMKSLRRL